MRSERVSFLRTFRCKMARQENCVDPCHCSVPWRSEGANGRVVTPASAPVTCSIHRTTRLYFYYGDRRMCEYCSLQMARTNAEISADLQMRHRKRCAHYVLRASLPSRTFFIVNTAFNMTSSGYFYSSFHNVLNPTVTVLGKIDLEYVDNSGKLSVLC